MLDHTLKEELIHLNQNLPSQTFGPGTAAEMEAGEMQHEKSEAQNNELTAQGFSREISPLEQLATKRVLLNTSLGHFGFDPHPTFPVFEPHSLETVCARRVPVPACRAGVPASQRATEARVSTRRIRSAICSCEFGEAGG
jgi:hypothetical protein